MIHMSYFCSEIFAILYCILLTKEKWKFFTLKSWNWVTKNTNQQDNNKTKENTILLYPYIANILSNLLQKINIFWYFIQIFKFSICSFLFQSSSSSQGWFLASLSFNFYTNTRIISKLFLFFLLLFLWFVQRNSVFCLHFVSFCMFNHLPSFSLFSSSNCSALFLSNNMSDYFICYPPFFLFINFFLFFKGFSFQTILQQFFSQVFLFLFSFL
jgi:hypothetical protein